MNLFKSKKRRIRIFTAWDMADRNGTADVIRDKYTLFRCYPCSACPCRGNIDHFKEVTNWLNN